MSTKRKKKSVAQINKTLRKKLDKVFSMVIRKRDEVCQRCGRSGKLDCSHIKDRRYMGVRWDMVNAIALCPGCHRFNPDSWHNDPEIWDWFKSKWPARAEYLQTLAREGKLEREWCTDELQERLAFLTAKLEELNA